MELILFQTFTNLNAGVTRPVDRIYSAAAGVCMSRCVIVNAVFEVIDTV